MAELDHVLTKFSAVDVPDSVATKVMALLRDYRADIHEMSCDSEGFTYNRDDTGF